MATADAVSPRAWRRRAAARLFSYAPERVRQIRLFLPLFRAALRCYAEELRYFYGRQVRSLDKPIAQQRQVGRSLLIRKRAHVLERYLFQPERYGAEHGAAMARELETLLVGVERGYAVRWAKRILREYHEGTPCPVLCNDVTRKPSPLRVEDLMNLLRTRRTRRVFDQVPLTEREKALICEAAQYAPSSCNRQTLELVFVEDSALRRQVARHIPGGRQFFDLAPCIVILLSEAGDYGYPADRVVPYVDAAAATQNIYLLCEPLGLGCCWGSFFSHGSVTDEAAFRRLLGIPDTHLIVGSLAIGRSRQFVCHIPRDNVVDRMHIDRYRSHD